MDEIMKNEETIVKAAEVIPAATPKVSWRKFGAGMVVVGVLGALAAGAYIIYTKVTGNKEEQGYCTDNVEVAKHDFLEESDDE